MNMPQPTPNAFPAQVPVSWGLLLTDTHVSMVIWTLEKTSVEMTYVRPALYVVSSMICRKAAEHMDSVTTESQMRFLVHPSCSARFTTALGFGLVVLSWKASGLKSRVTGPAISRSKSLSVLAGVGDASEMIDIAKTARAEMNVECMLESLAPVTEESAFR